jgi:RNA polymerase sigma-70 factor (ECF subfamily)
MQRDLVERAQRGDQEAFEGLVRLSANRLFAIAYRITRDHHRAEDAVQQTLVTIWDELPRLRDPDRFDAWTYRVITRNSVALAKREARGPGGGTVVRLLPDDADASRAPDDIGSVADREQIEGAFRQLKPDHRAVLTLHHVSGLSSAEIADVLGIPAGTDASRLHYATNALRAALDADARIDPKREQSA